MVSTERLSYHVYFRNPESVGKGKLRRLDNLIFSLNATLPNFFYNASWKLF